MTGNLRVIEGNVTADMQNIEHDGALEVHGNVDSGGFILATGDVRVTGEINNAKIKSIKGAVVIDGDVKGVGSLIVSGGGDISVRSVYNATLKAESNVRVKVFEVDAHIVAKKSIFVETADGVIEGGEIEAGFDILSNFAGNDHNLATVLKISDFKQREIYARLMNVRKEEARISKEIENLEKFIEVIKILGKKVVALPMEKKQDLATKVQKYNELKNELATVKSQSQGLVVEHRKDEDELERTIIVKKKIFPGVVVFIDDTKLLIQNSYSNVILYRRGIIIVGDYDQFMQRKKYAY
jgi:uncharacterized protein (DUF342 family)